MTRLLALPLALLAFHASVQPLSSPLRAELLTGRVWHAGCPVPLSRLRVLTITHWGFDHRPHTGQLVVNEDAAAPLARVFQRLYQLRSRFAICGSPTPTARPGRSRPMEISADRLSADKRCLLLVRVALGQEPGRSMPTGRRSISTRSRTPT
jgi:hypothetical protein